MANKAIFQGVSAIEVAGGMDGFVREVLAESKRCCMMRLEKFGQVGPDRVSDLLADMVTQVVMRRLEPDMMARAHTMLAEEFKHSKASRDMQAAEDKAMRRYERWSRELTDAVTAEILAHD